MAGKRKAVYGASPLKPNSRATRAEMEERAAFLIEYAERHGPVSVRGLYYQAEVAAVAGIDKTESGYTKVQRQVLALRREKRLPYAHISDATRWMRKPRSFDGPQDAVREWSRSYRRNLWRDADACVEVWCEKDALAGVIYPVTALYDVPLMVSRGYSSETFAHNAIENYEDEDRPLYVYYLGDFDRAGLDAARTLEEKLKRFGSEFGVTVHFEQIAITLNQIRELRLPTREPKRNTTADRNWPHAFACELDSMPPDAMRLLVENAINQHLPKRQLRILKEAEESERSFLQEWADMMEEQP